MAGTMKAAIVHQFTKRLRIEQVAIPEPGSGEVLVKVKASGVCHTGLHAASFERPVKPNLPFIPGRKAVGLVAKVGKGVIKEGDAVNLPWPHDACGHCEYCATGWETLREAQPGVQRITVRGSMVGTRKDLSEAIAFAAEGKLKTTVSQRRLDDINDIFAGVKVRSDQGRIVLSQL